MKPEYKIKVEQLKEKFSNAIRYIEELGIIDKGSKFIVEEKNNQVKIIIELEMATENGRNINYRTTTSTEYDDLNKVEHLIEIIENVKKIVRFSKHNVVFIPRNYLSDIPFDIYIDDQLITVKDLNDYIKSIDTEIDDRIKNEFGKLKIKSSKIFQLYTEVEMNQNIINHYHEIVNKLNSTTSTFEKFKILGQNNSKLNPPRNMRIVARDQEINWDKIFSILYNNSNPLDVKNQQMIEQYNEIINNIKLGMNISNNILNFPRNFTTKELHEISNFLEKLYNFLDKIEQEYTKKIEETSKIIKEIEKTIENVLEAKNKSNIIDGISAIKISKEEEINTEITEKEDAHIYHKTPVHEESKFLKTTSTTASVIEELRRQQLEKLTQEERDALFCYKSSMYIPINKVTVFLRKNQINLSEIESHKTMYNQLIQIISKCYEKYCENYYQFEVETGKQESRREDYGKVENRIFGQMLTREEYINIVLSSIPHLESALSKIKTTEDIVVYRGVNNTNPGLASDGRFLSTSLKLEVAQMFLESRDRKNEHTKQEIYQIFIPKGSPVIAFTKDLYVEKSHYNFDKYIKGNPYFSECNRLDKTEEQFEIIIDPANYDFQETYFNYHQNNKGEIISRYNIIATPKSYILTESQDKSR